jgi:hypothetical protein
MGPLVAQVLMASLVLTVPQVLKDPQDPLVVRDVMARKVSPDLLDLMERG